MHKSNLRSQNSRWNAFYHCILPKKWSEKIDFFALKRFQKKRYNSKTVGFSKMRMKYKVAGNWILHEIGLTLMVKMASVTICAHKTSTERGNVSTISNFKHALRNDGIERHSPHCAQMKLIYLGVYRQPGKCRRPSEGSQIAAFVP